MTVPYEVLLDVAKLAVEKALEAPDRPSFHERYLTEMRDQLDAMYGAAVSNKAAAE